MCVGQGERALMSVDVIGCGCSIEVLIIRCLHCARGEQNDEKRASVRAKREVRKSQLTNDNVGEQRVKAQHR